MRVSEQHPRGILQELRAAQNVGAPMSNDTAEPTTSELPIDAEMVRTPEEAAGPAEWCGCRECVGWNLQTRDECIKGILTRYANARVQEAVRAERKATAAAIDAGSRRSGLWDMMARLRCGEPAKPPEET